MDASIVFKIIPYLEFQLVGVYFGDNNGLVYFIQIKNLVYL